ncbi:uncharacterized protein [Spinacia oleracea]|uniref:Uncharacterized protein n=1 Tax=Spinacia oleracea TaxID=3562 RepID=A0ABM3QYG4_SPIOL|nr:uncharacterized protein LOC130463351 [Spinacia oleracea]
MPYKTYAKLNLGDLSPTSMSLQLADRSVMYPLGRVEDVPLVIDKLTFLFYFVVLDIDEDAQAPIILGRPFLATAGTLIDVQGGLITLKVGDTKSSFNLPHSEGCFSKMKSFMKVNTITCIVDNPSNDFCAFKCGIELARSHSNEKEVHAIPKVLGDTFEDVTTIPEIFGMNLDVEAKATPPKVKHKPGTKAKEKLSRGWLGCFPMCCGVDKVFVPKGDKKNSKFDSGATAPHLERLHLHKMSILWAVFEAAKKRGF